MTIDEFCQRWQISRKKAREMHKAGILILDSGASPIAASALGALRAGVDLSPLHLVHLFETPDDLARLGYYQDKAKRALEAIGDLAQDRAPREVSAIVPSAARGNQEAIERLRAWICEALPAAPVYHAWIGTRLLVPMPQVTRQEDARLVNKAIGRVRRLPEFNSWWHVEAIRNGRKRTIYHRPLDL